MKVFVLKKRTNKSQWELGTIRLIDFNFIKPQI